MSFCKICNRDYDFKYYTKHIKTDKHLNKLNEQKMNIILPNVLESSIAIMIINDAQDLDDKINNHILSLKKMEKERGKYINIEKIVRLELEYHTMVGNFYYNDTIKLLNREKEPDHEVSVINIRRFQLEFEATEPVEEKILKFIELIRYLSICPKLVGLHDDFKKKSCSKIKKLKTDIVNKNVANGVIYLKEINEYEKIIRSY